MKKVLFASLGMLAFASYSQKLATPHRPLQAGCSAALFNFTENRHKLDTSVAAGRGMADNYMLWDNGSTIVVKFVGGGSPWVKSKVAEFAKGWEQYANIKFNFVPDNYAGATNVRVKLGRGKGANSQLGTACNLIPQTEQTVNLDTTWFVDLEYYINDFKAHGPVFQQLKSSFSDLSKLSNDDILEWIYNLKDLHWNLSEFQGTTQHEFGHVLGLMHEQSYPGAISWNKADSVYQYYYRTNGWSKEQTDYQVFRVNDQFYSNGTQYDPKSIMQYPVDPWQTTNGFSVPRNNVMSEGDKRLISALYPKDKLVSDKEVAKISISNMKTLQVSIDNTRKGLSVLPSLDMKTNSKLGEVYFVARVYAVQGDKYYEIKASTDDYNVAGNVGVAYRMRLLPNTSTSYNKGTKNMELFIPFTAIPNIDAKQVIVVFDVFLIDTNNGNMTKQMYSSMSNSLNFTR